MPAPTRTICALRRSCWLGSAITATGIALLPSAPLTQARVDPDRIATSLSAVIDAAEARDRAASPAHGIDYEEVFHTFFGLNWTGASPDDSIVVCPPPSRKRIDEQLRLLLIQIDTRDPAASVVHANRIGDGQHLVLHAGDRVPLAGSLTRVHAIRPDSVEFELDGVGGGTESVALAGTGETVVAIPPVE